MSRLNLPAGLGGWIWLAIIIIPVYYVVITSLKTQEGYFGQNPLALPSSPALENYQLVLAADFAKYFMNSTIVTLGAVIPTVLVAFMAQARDAVVRHEHELGKLDAIAGDGDHRIGMRRGVDAAVAAADEAAGTGLSVDRVLSAAGEAWSERAGGTSGALWESALTAAGRALGNKAAYRGRDAAAAVTAFVDAVTGLGKADVGDKTMVDALLPFRDTFLAAFEDGAPVTGALTSAVTAARQAADATASLRPLKGRARPLAEKSLGHPDPGAVSFALIVTRVSDYFDSSEHLSCPGSAALIAGTGARA
ncbi:Dihydroxyacetone kinase, ATP-dependent [Arthrobacter sp. 9AX]|uniref:DAK2 domain-containing protein n=1 Tax=Arthrobacter sp. 9AX TaxID=2653131 RepID=UPI0012F44064|nr:Dihydroxyacetone kinase, ATP-dependent [Arthrobacter sp. 9AX]